MRGKYQRSKGHEKTQLTPILTHFIIPVHPPPTLYARPAPGSLPNPLKELWEITPSLLFQNLCYESIIKPDTDFPAACNFRTKSWKNSGILPFLRAVSGRHRGINTEQIKLVPTQKLELKMSSISLVPSWAFLSSKKARLGQPCSWEWARAQNQQDPLASLGTHGALAAWADPPFSSICPPPWLQWERKQMSPPRD